jgi:hypothetical protein
MLGFLRKFLRVAAFLAFLFPICVRAFIVLTVTLGCTLNEAGEGCSQPRVGWIYNSTIDLVTIPWIIAAVLWTASIVIGKKMQESKRFNPYDPL